MATAFQPPPTYALPILVDEKTGRAQFSPIWLKWFVDMAQVLSSFGGGSGSADHNMLSGLQGGASSQYYHLDAAEYAAVANPDGDKGDITVSGGGTVWTLDLTLDQINAPAASVDFNGQQAVSFLVENRTSDPGSPTTGQIWLRTDL